MSLLRLDETPEDQERYKREYAQRHRPYRWIVLALGVPVALLWIFIDPLSRMAERTGHAGLLAAAFAIATIAVMGLLKGLSKCESTCPSCGVSTYRHRRTVLTSCPTCGAAFR